jgi:hypothetical protein
MMEFREDSKLLSIKHVTGGSRERPLATIVVDPIPQKEMGYATSLIALARNLGAGIGISVFTAFLARGEQFHQVRLAASMSTESHLPLHTLSGMQAYLGQH